MKRLMVLALLLFALPAASRACDCYGGAPAAVAPLAYGYSYGYAAQLVVPQVAQVQAPAAYAAPVVAQAYAAPAVQAYAAPLAVRSYAYGGSALAVRQRVVVSRVVAVKAAPVALRQRVVVGRRAAVVAAPAPAAAVRVNAAPGARVRVRVR